MSGYPNKSVFMLRIKGGMIKGGGLQSQNCFVFLSLIPKIKTLLFEFPDIFGLSNISYNFDSYNSNLHNFSSYNFNSYNSNSYNLIYKKSTNLKPENLPMVSNFHVFMGICVYCAYIFSKLNCK